MRKKIVKQILFLVLSVTMVTGQMQISTYAANSSSSTYVTSLNTDIESKTLYVGGPEEYTKSSISTSVEPNNANQSVTYESSDSNIVSVDSDGGLKALSEGTVKIKVMTIGLKKNGDAIIKNISVKVKAFVYPKSISISCDNPVIQNGETTSMAVKILPTKATDTSYTFVSSDTSLATVDSNGTVKANNSGKTGEVNITAASEVQDISGNKLTSSINVTIKSSSNEDSTSTVSIHDPSIFQDPVSNTYYSYGTHIGAAKSKDAVNWSYIANSSVGYGQGNGLFDKWYVEEFKDIYKWLYSYTDDDIAKIVSGEKSAPEGIWAIDVTYSKEASESGNDPYLMYVTVCNNSWKSAIVLCTSDNPEGGFKYKKTIVCSDYTDSEVSSGNTNLLSVLGLSNVDAVKEKYGDYYFPDGFRSSGAEVPDCIDPHPFFDQDNNFYLIYGSFTCYGGIRIIKMDAATGDRSQSLYDYEKSDNEVISDPYFGKKIANKYGEGPYMLMVKDTTSTSSTGYYYFLFYSQGNLNPYGGYNMRMMRSEYPDHGFVDYSGNSSLTTSVTQTNLGVRIMDNYKFSFMDYASTANGGNSAIVTSDGKILLEYHSKSNDGTYGHIVKTQQMFLNQDGWLVITPFTYKGETLNKVSSSDISGNYEFIYHRLSYSNTGSLTNKFDYLDSVIETFNTDGTISGSYTGTWSYDEDSNYITVTFGGNIYKGVVLEEKMDDNSCTKTIVFGADGKDNRTIWGGKIVKSDAEKAETDMEKLTVNSNVDSDFDLTTTGFFGSNITWTSDNNAIEIDGSKAKVTCQDYDTDVKLTASIVNGATVLTKSFDVTVNAEEISIDTVVRTSYIELPSKTAAGKSITWNSSNPDVINADGTVVNPESGSIVVTLSGKIDNSDKTLSFDITVLPTTIDSYLYTQDYEDVADISKVWTSTSAQASISLESDTEHGKYVKFAPGTANSRGASSNFDLDGDTTSVYTVELDCALTPGNNQETDFSLTGTDYAYTSNSINNGISSGYIVKLASNNSTTWTINDSSETVIIPSGQWVHITAVVSTSTKNVKLTIKDDNSTYYDGKVSLNGIGELNGLYIRGGRYQSVTCVDNIKVY